MALEERQHGLRTNPSLCLSFCGFLSGAGGGWGHTFKSTFNSKTQLSPSFLHIRGLCLRRRGKTGGSHKCGWSSLRLVYQHKGAQTKTPLLVFQFQEAHKHQDARLRPLPANSPHPSPPRKAMLSLRAECRPSHSLHTYLPRLGLRFPPHTNHRDMRPLIMRAKGPTCEGTWLKMLSAGKAISSRQHGHGLSDTSQGSTLQKSRTFFPLSPPSLPLFFS